MSDYTPTTEQVLKQWVAEWAPSPNLEAQFHRWLAAHDAEKRAEWEAERRAGDEATRRQIDGLASDYYEAVIRAERAEQGETEWEYGATNVFDDKPVSIRDTLAEAVEAQAFYTRERGRKTNLMMRAKAVPAGPWLPVPGPVRVSDSPVRDSDSEESEGKA